MTVCNMSIEAGARAGHDRPGRDDVRLPRRAAARAAGAPHFDEAVAGGARCAPTTARLRRARSCSTPQASSPTSPGEPIPGRWLALAGNVPDPSEFEDPADARCGRAGAGVHGTRAGHAAARRPRRHRLHRLVHELADRGPPGRRRGAARAHGRDGVRALVVPGLAPGQGAGRGRGTRQGLPAAGFEWREPGCSMCLGDEPRQARAGGALRLDVEPQLRGAPGTRRAHAPRLACGRRGNRGRRPLRRRPRGPDA